MFTVCPFEPEACSWHLFSHFRCFLTQAIWPVLCLSPFLQVPETSSFGLKGTESRETDSCPGWTRQKRRGLTGWFYRIQSSLSWPALHCRATSNWERTSWENLGQDSCREICRHISKPSLVDTKWRSKRSASKEWEKSKYLSWRRLTFLTGLPLVTTTPSEVMLHFSSCNRGSLLRHYSLNFIAEKSS